MNACLRTNESSKNQMTDDNHYHIVFPITELNFGLVTQRILHYKHLVCLGVVRKNVFLWHYGPIKTKLQSTLINQISSHLVFMKPHMPKIFARKPRSLLEAKMWKVTEFHQFLMYTGRTMLLDKLKSALYRNFFLR